MYTKILISTVFFILLCTGQLVNKANLPQGERPMIYESSIIRLLLSLISIVVNITSVLFIFYDWKILVLLLLLSITIGKRIITPLIENIIAYFILKITK